MPELSPITPIPAARPRAALEAEDIRSAPLERLPEPPTPVSAIERADRLAARLLGGAAVTLGVGFVGRRMLETTVYASPAVEVVLVGVMAAAAIGVGMRWRPARWLARAIGYGFGLAAYWRVSGMSLPFGGTDWWLAAILTIEAGLLGTMMNFLGWGGDEDA